MSKYIFLIDWLTELTEVGFFTIFYFLYIRGIISQLNTFNSVILKRATHTVTWDIRLYRHLRVPMTADRLAVEFSLPV